MPQLNPEFFISQLFWLTIFFVFLFVFLWKVSLPRIATVLEKRQSKIDDNLSKAKELQEQANVIEKSINNQINNAKLETDEKIRKTITTLQEEASSELLSIDKELEQKVLDSEKEILKKKDEQMKLINEEIAKITKITVSKIADLDIKNDDIDKAIINIKGTIN